MRTNIELQLLCLCCVLEQEEFEVKTADPDWTEERERAASVSEVEQVRGLDTRISEPQAG